MALSDAAAYIVANWRLNDSSGTRYDRVGASHGTDNNTVTTGTGIIHSTCADFERSNSEFLSVADNAPLSMGDVVVTFRAWVKLESKTGAQTILSKWAAGTGTDREYWLRYFDSPDRFEFVVDDGSGTFPTVQANNLGSPSTGTWYHVVAWHDPAANQIGIAINAGTADTQSWSNGILSGTGDFAIGAVVEAGGNHFFDGLIDDAVVLKGYVLDATERTADYNGGAGIAAESWATDGLSSLAPTVHFDASDADRVFTTYSADGFHTGTPADGNNVEVLDNEHYSTSLPDVAFIYMADGPTFKSGGSAVMKTGLSELDFDGTDDSFESYNQKGTAAKTVADFIDIDGWLFGGSFYAPTGSITTNQTGNNRYLNNILIGDPGAYLTVYFRDAGSSVYKFGAVIASGGAYSTTLEVDISLDKTTTWRLHYDNTNLYLRVKDSDGERTAQVAAGQIDSITDTTQNRLRIGLGNNAGAFGAFRFGELFSLDYAPSGGNLTTIDTYLDDKWLAPSGIIQVGGGLGGGFFFKKTYRPRPFAPGFGR